MKNKLITLSLLLMPFSSWGYYSNAPDAKAILLGQGDLAGYTQVYYVCDKLPDGTANTSGDSAAGTLEAPFYSLDKAMTMLNTVGNGITAYGGGGAVAFCRGGKFYRNSDVTDQFFSGRQNNPTTLRDYQPDKGSREEPKLIAGPNAGPRLLNFNDSGEADSEEGLVIENLGFYSINADKAAIYFRNDADFVEIRNVHFYNISDSITVDNATTTPQLRVAATAMDLELVHNVNPAPDTITITSAHQFPTTTRPGDTLLLSGTVSNNKSYRITSIDATRKIATLTTDTNYPDFNDVVSEVVAGAVVTQYRGDGKNQFFNIHDIKVENTSGTAFFGALNYSTLHDSEFFSIGFLNDATKQQHAIYPSTFNDAKIYNNKIWANSEKAGAGCDALPIVVHGHVTNLEIYDNAIYQDSNKVQNGCWGIAVDPGYSDSQGAEYFHNVSIHNNTVSNVGNVGIGVGACTDCSITDNVITSTKTTGVANCITVPSNTSYIGTSDEKMAGTTTITGNTCVSYGTSAVAKTAGNYGIHIQANDTTAEATAVIDVHSNTIKDYYECVRNSSTGSATVNIGVNTKSGCIVDP